MAVSMQSMFSTVLKLGSLGRRCSRALDRDKVTSVLFLDALSAHIDEVKEVLDYDWFTFSLNMDKYLAPVVEGGGSGVSQDMLAGAATAVYEHCLRIPALAKFSKILAHEVEEGYWAEELWTLEELINVALRFHQLLSRPVPRLPEDDTGSGKRVGYVNIPLYFCTNREASGSTEPHHFFRTGRDPQLTFGTVIVSVPDVLDLAHTLSALPSGWSYVQKRGGKKSRKKLVLQAIMKLDEARFVQQMERRSGVDGFVYVPGYNHTFSSSAQRLAQIAYHLAQEGPLILFTWPSFQSVQSYVGDEANAMWSIPYFERFLYDTLMARGSIQKVHLIAHSMGSRLVLYALGKLWPGRLPASAPKVGRVVLAAPDFDAGEFEALAPDLLSKIEHLALYCASNDQALRASTSLHGGYPRLGDFRRAFAECTGEPACRARANMDIIDTTGADTSMLRHAYLFSKFGLLNDACQFLGRGLNPEKRSGLVEQSTKLGVKYWSLSEPEAMSLIRMLEEEEPSLLEVPDSP